jgi:hypothetical protein
VEDKSPHPGDGERRVKLLALLAMALATLGSAWSSYQSSLWTGRQTFLLMDSTLLSRQSKQKAVEANQKRSVDASMFMEYARDLYEGKTELSEFFLARMRPEFRAAIQAWIKSRPLKNPNAPSTPFVMPQYRLQDDDDARDLEAKSNIAHERAQNANHTADTYTLLGVVFTSSLFLAGLVTGLDDKFSRQATLALSLAALLTASGFLLHLPIAHLS